MPKNNFPKLHNAMWPGLVGKGSPGAEPCIDFDTMLDLTAKAEVNGARFDGVDLFLYECRLLTENLVPRAVSAYKWAASSEFDQYPFTPADEASMNKLLGVG